ncbi:MAG: DinB family protein [Tepidiformaceae bacterium]
MDFAQLPPLTGYDGLDGIKYDPLLQTLTLWYSSADGTDDGPIRAVTLRSKGVFWAKVVSEEPLPRYTNFLLHHGALDSLTVEEGSPRVAKTEPGGKFTIVKDELTNFVVELGEPPRCAHFKVTGNYLAAEWLCSGYSVEATELPRDEFYTGAWISETTPARAAGLLSEAMNDLRLAIEGVPDDTATQRFAGGSSIAWLASHVTQGLDSLVLYRFTRRLRDPLLSDPNLGNGGDGLVIDWPALRARIRVTHELAGQYLAALTEEDLLRNVPYDGSIAVLRPVGLTLEYALLRVAAHHFAHAGEIAAIRSAIGSPLPDNREWGQLFL